MHDARPDTGQLGIAVRQVDDAIELARTWSHDLCHAAETAQLDRLAHKLEQAMLALGEAHAALEGYEDAIDLDSSVASPPR